MRVSLSHTHTLTLTLTHTQTHTKACPYFLLNTRGLRTSNLNNLEIIQEKKQALMQNIVKFESN